MSDKDQFTFEEEDDFPETKVDDQNDSGLKFDFGDDEDEVPAEEGLSNFDLGDEEFPETDLSAAFSDGEVEAENPVPDVVEEPEPKKKGLSLFGKKGDKPKKEKAPKKEKPPKEKKPSKEKGSGGGSGSRLALIVLLLVVAAGGGAYYFMGLGETTSSVPTAPVPAKKAAKAVAVPPKPAPAKQAPAKAAAPAPKPAPTTAKAPAPPQPAQAPAKATAQAPVPPKPKAAAPAPKPAPAQATAKAPAPPKPAPVKQEPAKTSAPAPKPATATAKAPVPPKPAATKQAPVKASAPAPKTAPAPAKTTAQAPVPPKPAPAKVAAPAGKPAPAQVTAKAPAAPKPAPVPVKQTPGGAYALDAGSYLLESNRDALVNKIKKLGYEPLVTPVDATLGMTRLRLGTFSKTEVKDALEIARSIEPGSYSAPAGDNFVIYAGTFLQSGNVEKLKKRFIEEGIKVYSEPVEVVRTLSRIRFGSFATKDDATAAVASAANGGVKAVVVKSK